MKIRLVAFATAAEILGSRERTLDCIEGSTVADLLDLLEQSAPDFSKLRGRLAIAVDGRLAETATPLREGVEVALLPPVSGGCPAARARLVHDPIDVDAIRASVAHPTCGAQILFVGCVRADGDDPTVTHLTYEAYEPMAAVALERICDDLGAGASGIRIAIAHRLGDVPCGEPSVVIATASAHRRAAYDASRQALERLKREVPIWKREHFSDGSRRWREEEPLKTKA